MVRILKSGFATQTTCSAPQLRHFSESIGSVPQKAQRRAVGISGGGGGGGGGLMLLS
jgi:hypothetical protein